MVSSSDTLQPELCMPQRIVETLLHNSCRKVGRRRRLCGGVSLRRCGDERTADEGIRKHRDKGVYLGGCRNGVCGPQRRGLLRLRGTDAATIRAEGLRRSSLGAGRRGFAAHGREGRTGGHPPYRQHGKKQQGKKGRNERLAGEIETHDWQMIPFGKNSEKSETEPHRRQL